MGLLEGLFWLAWSLLVLAVRLAIGALIGAWCVVRFVAELGWSVGSTAVRRYRARGRTLSWPVRISLLRVDQDLAPATGHVAKILSREQQQRPVTLMLNTAGSVSQTWQIDGCSADRDLLLQLLARNAEPFLMQAAGLEMVIDVTLTLRLAPLPPDAEQVPPSLLLDVESVATH